jgi:hypothetical protein
MNKMIKFNCVIIKVSVNKINRGIIYEDVRFTHNNSDYYAFLSELGIVPITVRI